MFLLYPLARLTASADQSFYQNYLYKLELADIAYWVTLPVCDSGKLLGTVSFYHILVIVTPTPQGVEVEELLNKDKHVVTTVVLQKTTKPKKIVCIKPFYFRNSCSY